MGTTNLVTEVAIVDFIELLWKLCLSPNFKMKEVTERVWDYDSMQNINEVIGYEIIEEVWD